MIFVLRQAQHEREIALSRKSEAPAAPGRARGRGKRSLSWQAQGEAGAKGASEPF